MRHLLVTNDFPPKVGGIQNYLWELWRRLPPDEAVVLTRRHPGWRAFDAAQPLDIRRPPQPFLVCEPVLLRQIRRTVAEVGADLVLFDPAVPVGALGPGLGHPYGVILHGAEVTVPGRLPVSRSVLGRVLRNAELVVTAGEYSTREAERAAQRPLPTVPVPPGVDADRFHPIGAHDRREVRQRYGVDADAELVVSVSRLVPRKGMDTLVRAAALLRAARPRLQVLIAGTGRDSARLERLIARTNAPVRLVGRVDDAELPGFYAMADLFVMLCRTRWAGLEQEGFGIVFLEAAACGVPQLAGRSGGAGEAVLDGRTGVVIDPPDDHRLAARRLAELLDDDDRRLAMGRAARRRAVDEYSYDLLAARLDGVLHQWHARGSWP
ncbi:MAG: glycosyltransferase family 4 protein [Acidimicrobiales bacterium]|nr:glycosyltransferase family 4 protein [Acidimicrobiales bacterium]